LKYNKKRKKIILSILNKEKNLTANQILERMDFETTIQSLATLLLRYTKRFGYLHREKNHNKYIYRLNPTGLRKLRYFESLL